MHTRTTGQQIAKQAAAEWQAFLPALPSPGDLRDLFETRAALQQAEMVLHMQEERIRALEAMVTIDDLTGVANRRGFAEAFERELSLARRDTDGGGIVAMVDIDNFKAVNDCYGHQAGDAYLCAAARALRDAVRASDIVARLGGDEFALLLTRVDEADGANSIARIEKLFHSRVLPWNGAGIPLRASFGFAAYNGACTADAALRVADIRLYARKPRARTITAAAVSR